MTKTRSTSACTRLLAPGPQQSINYTAKGVRVNPQGGIYWIPGNEFDCVVRLRETHPEVLNRYTFTPLES